MLSSHPSLAVAGALMLTLFGRCQKNGTCCCHRGREGREDEELPPHSYADFVFLLQMAAAAKTADITKTSTVFGCPSHIPSFPPPSVPCPPPGCCPPPYPLLCPCPLSTLTLALSPVPPLPPLPPLPLLPSPLPPSPLPSPPSPLPPLPSPSPSPSPPSPSP